MRQDTEKAKRLLKENGYTCVLCKASQVISSMERGVKPLLEFLDDEESYEGYCASDKVVGKAAAMIYVALQISELYTGVISRAAHEVLKKHNITVYYDEEVDIILRRDKQDICPMEKTTRDIDDIDEAIYAIRIRLTELQHINK